MVRKEKGNHSKIVTLAQDGTKEVSKNEWNAGHDEDGMEGSTSQTSTITISSGALLATDTLTVAAAESGTADTLDTITTTNTNVEDKIELYADSGDTITVAHEAGGAGQIHLLDGAAKTASETVPILLVRKGTDWHEYGGGGGGSGTITNKFTAAGTFNAISGLLSEAIHVIHVNNADVTAGGITVEVDGTTKLIIAAGIEDASLVISPSSKVDVVAGNASLKNAIFNSVSFSISQDTFPKGVTFNTTGSKMYVIGEQNDTVFEYDLSTNFDLSTAVYNSVSFSVTSQETVPNDVAFNTTGSKMYIIGNANDTVFEYDLSTNFDISTAVYNSVSFSVASEETLSNGLTFNATGSKMYICGDSSDAVFEYDLSTNFDISTAVYNSVSFSVASEETTPRSVVFNSDGTKMYIVGNTNDTVFEYDLSTAFDVSSAVYNNVSFSVNSEESAPNGLAFNSDGTKFYIVGISSDTVYEYDLPAFNGTARIIIA